MTLDTKPTPLPWKSLLVVCAVRLAEPVAATMCFPFLPFVNTTAAECHRYYFFTDPTLR